MNVQALQTRLDSMFDGDFAMQDASGAAITRDTSLSAGRLSVAASPSLGNRPSPKV